jgi:uncharacterized protein involved in exopolysaccharide biosynthesis
MDRYCGLLDNCFNHFLITVLTTLIGTLLWPPTYEATATLVLDYDSSNPMNLTTMPPVTTQSAEYINTQIEIIKSRQIALRVIDHLRLDRHPGIIEAFNKAKTRNPLYFWQSDRNLDIKVWLADEFLLKYLKVEPARDARFLYIRFLSLDPNFSAVVANAYAEAYADYNLELKVMPFKEASQWFSEKLNDVKEKADEVNKKFSAYKKSKGIISLEGRYYDDAVQRLDQLTRDLVAAKIRLHEAQVAVRRIEGSKGSYESLPEVISNAFIQNLKAEKIRLEKDLSEFSEKFGTMHPQYLRLQSELQTVNSKLNAEIKNIIDAIKQDYHSASERVRALENVVASQKNEVLNLHRSRYDMESLKRDVETSHSQSTLIFAPFFSISGFISSKILIKSSLREIFSFMTPFVPVLIKINNES